MSARGAHLIFGFQKGALIRGRRSSEGGAHLKSQVHNNITSTFLFKNNKTINKKNMLHESFTLQCLCPLLNLHQLLKIVALLHKHHRREHQMDLHQARFICLIVCFK